MVDRLTVRFARRHGIRGSAISGPFESVDLGRSREVAGVGRSEPCHVDGVKHGAVRSMNLWTVASARDARYGLRGVRVGEANNSGPRRLCRQRLSSSSEDEFLFRPIEGRDVIPRMESRIESGSNRFAALADAETVPAGTQELEDVGVIRERSSIAGDCDRVPETILDALVEDLERPSRRLVLVSGQQRARWRCPGHRCGGLLDKNGGTNYGAAILCPSGSGPTQIRSENQGWSERDWGI